jgi:hypothetical protein
MVSQAGFQRGTREYAAHYGIDIRTLEDLPRFRETLAMRVASVCIPGEEAIAQPDPSGSWDVLGGSCLVGPATFRLVPLIGTTSRHMGGT